MIDIELTFISDVILLRPRVFKDDRGFFFESWQKREFAAAGIDREFVQDNHSQSVQYTLRGLHYQVERPQGKLVRVVRGEVFDVAVDIRRSSPTFGKWVGAALSEDNQCLLWVPPGFAHGFLVLSKQADFLYRCTDYWDCRLERSISWNDPDLHITWPLPEGTTPTISQKDSLAPPLREAECLP